MILRMLGVLAITCGAAAQDIISPADLTAAYQRFDAAYGANAIADERAAVVGPAFDASTSAFFARQYEDAIRTINGLTLSLLKRDQEAPTATAIALRVTASSDVYVSGEPAPVVSVLRLYETASTPQKFLAQRLICPLSGALST